MTWCDVQSCCAVCQFNDENDIFSPQSFSFYIAIRAAAKNGSMTDEEWRARAGDAALALVNLIGGMGDDDDDESSDGSSEDGPEES